LKQSFTAHMPLLQAPYYTYKVKNLKKLEIISTLLRRIGIPPPTVPPGESFV